MDPKILLYRRRRRRRRRHNNDDAGGAREKRAKKKDEDDDDGVYDASVRGDFYVAREDDKKNFEENTKNFFATHF